MKKQIAPLILFFLLVSQNVHAVTVGSETEASADSLSETLSASGPLGKSETWDWGVDLNHMRTSEALNRKSTIIDEATELNLKAGWQNATGCTASATLIGSMVPQENLKSSGLALGTGYTYTYGSKSQTSEVDASEHDENSPSISVRAGISLRNYAQTFSEARTIQRDGRPDILRPSTGSQDLNQRAVGVSATWEPQEKLRITAAAEVFSYDRNVGDFSRYLESRRALERANGTVTSTLGGLPNVSYSLGAEVDLTEKIDLELRETYSVISEDLSTSRQTRIVLATDLGELWRASIGANFTQSLMTGQETAGIIGIEAAF